MNLALTTPADPIATAGLELAELFGASIEAGDLDAGDALAVLCSACANLLLCGSNEPDDLLAIWDGLARQVADLVRQELAN